MTTEGSDQERRGGCFRSAAKPYECVACGAPIIKGARHFAVHMPEGVVRFCLLCESKGTDPRLYTPSPRYGFIRKDSANG